jgi:hypothetical protein
MSEPIFRDAVEDEDHENFDPSAMYEYLDSQHKVAANEEVKDEETEKMLEEIVQLTIAEEVERFPWREPTIGGSNLADRYSVSRILELDYSDGNPSILARMAKEAARVIQFPENTAYLHALGLFSSATVVNFQVEYNHKFIPTGMYTLGAQPSGSGKSSAHGYFLDPIAHALKKRYRDVSMFHANINGEIEITQKQADKAKTDYAMIREYAGRIQMMENEKLSRPLVDAPKKNTTPQAAEEVAAKQGGVINVCSDEAEALDTYLGLSYNDGKTNPDNGVFIAAFGGDMMGTARVSREGISTNVRGAFAVIAQNQSVDTMIRAGAAGRGVSERCLIIKEPNRIGYRTYTRERSMFDVDLKAEYQALCENVVNGTYPISLSFSEQCRDMIVDLKNDIEPQCRPGAKYGDPQIRGFASKIEQHISKLAGNFHIAEQWNPMVTRTPSKEIQVHNLSKAMIVCMDLLDSYKALIENESSMSASKLVLEVIGHMKGYALKGVKAFPVDKLRLSVMKEAWYGAIEGKKVDFLINLLARCEEMNFCHVKEIGKDKKSWQVLINPALRNFTIAMGD